MSSPTMPATYSNTVRIGYARVSARTQDHQLQLDALAAAGCRDVVVETASTRAERPKLRATLATLKRRSRGLDGQGLGGRGPTICLALA